MTNETLFVRAAAPPGKLYVRTWYWPATHGAKGVSFTQYASRSDPNEFAQSTVKETADVAGLTPAGGVMQ